MDKYNFIQIPIEYNVYDEIIISEPSPLKNELEIEGLIDGLDEPLIVKEIVKIQTPKKYFSSKRLYKIVHTLKTFLNRKSCT